MHYPPVVDFAQVSAVQRRLKKLLQRGSTLEDLVAMALVLLRHMHAYDMPEQSWTEYKSFVRQEDARFNAARWRPAWGACQSVHDPTRRRLSMLLRLSKKSDSAFYKTFNTFSGLVEDIAQFASAWLNAPRLHYAVVRDLVVALARPRFTEEVMAQTFVPIDRNAGYAHTRMRGLSSARIRSRGWSAPRQQQRRSASRRHDDQGNPPQGQVEPSEQGVPAAVTAPLRDDPRVARLERKIEDLNFQVSGLGPALLRLNYLEGKVNELFALGRPVPPATGPPSLAVPAAAPSSVHVAAPSTAPVPAQLE
ncbi:hypothetical protein AeNC1_016519, partial [Aphanomyces euteiches]